MKKFLLLIILFSINFTFTFAHQPKLIKYSPSSNKPHDVIEPEISCKAVTDHIKSVKNITKLSN